jgi:hypothetical protein
MKRISLLVFALSLLFAGTAVPCEMCKYSPNGWGFCRPADLGSGDGSETCTQVVVDTFNGTTDCVEKGECHGALEGVGGGVNPDDCWWTDLYGNCIVNLY